MNAFSQIGCFRPKVVTNISGFTAHLGAMAVKDQQTFNVTKIVVHKDYQNDEQPKPHDLAMLTLDRKIKFTDMARPICFPKPKIEENSVKVYTAGWGTVRDKAGDFDSCATNQFGPKKFHGCKGETKTVSVVKNQFPSTNKNHPTGALAIRN